MARKTQNEEPKVSKRTTSAKRGSKKDPNAPKRGLSAYLFFASEKRDAVRKEEPSLSFGETGRKLGQMWRAMNDDQRRPYVEKAEQDKKRYDQEKREYDAGNTGNDSS